VEYDQLLLYKFALKYIRPLEVHNEELHNLYSSPSVIRMIKSRRMRWVGHAARMGEKRNAYSILWKSQKVRDL
jgi:hypothetical protein